MLGVGVVADVERRVGPDDLVGAGLDGVLEGTASTDVKASGVLTIQGSLVKIN